MRVSGQDLLDYMMALGQVRDGARRLARGLAGCDAVMSRHGKDGAHTVAVQRLNRLADGASRTYEEVTPDVDCILAIIKGSK